MNFASLSHVLPWKAPSGPTPTTATTPPVGGVKNAAEPAFDPAVKPAARNPTNQHDSDDDTDDSQSSSSKDTAAPTLPPQQSFARRFFGGSRVTLPTLARRNTRSVSDFSESDFAPLPGGTPVWTRYGLGAVVTPREDGILVIALQGGIGTRPVTLYLHSGADEECYALPAIRFDWVDTPRGEGEVLSFNASSQSYRVRVNDHEYTIARGDVRRAMPSSSRRQTTPAATSTSRRASACTQASSQPAAALSKGINSAFKSIVTTSSELSTSTLQLVSNYYYVGQCVVTTFGPGHITTLDQHAQRAQVQLTWGAMAYLSTDAILYYAKALVGMEVNTKFGHGVVLDVRAADAMYTVRLHNVKPGESEVVYVHESDLARARRLRLSTAAPTQVVKDTLAYPTKLFAFAQNKVKLFGHSTSGVSDATVKTEGHPAKDQPAPEPRMRRKSVGERLSDTLKKAKAGSTTKSSSASTKSRSKSVCAVESDSDREQEPSTAGI
ncbi:hypothetical protein ATCC90586_001315 [Pythium insidiosum]|nr:hypothetical protein ATCC90586_001315 [Pythium insidiosum]